LFWDSCESRVFIQQHILWRKTLMSSNNPSQQFSRYANRPHRTDAPIRPGTILTTRDPFAEVLAFMRRLANEKFYGVCSVCFRDGEIQTVRTEQTIRLGALAT
jgi:hypothetical protein